MRWKTALAGYVFGTGMASILLWVIAHYLPMSMWIRDDRAVPIILWPVGYAGVRLLHLRWIPLLIQLFLFWGIAGALATQGRLAWARYTAIAMLIVHCCGYLAMPHRLMALGSILAHGIRSMGGIAAIGCAFLPAVLVATLLWTWCSGWGETRTAKRHPGDGMPAISPRQRAVARWAPACTGYALAAIASFLLTAVLVPFMGMGPQIELLAIAFPIGYFGLLSSDPLFGLLFMQVFVFWGGVGVLVALGRLRWARYSALGLLAIHYGFVVWQLTAGAMPIHFYDKYERAWCEGYAVFQACLVATLVWTGTRGWKASRQRRAAAAQTAWACEEVSTPERRPRSWIFAAIVSAAVLALAGVATERLFRVWAPFPLYMLDLETGKERPVRAAADTYVLGVDEKKGVFTTFRCAGGYLETRVISFDGKRRAKNVAKDNRPPHSNGYQPFAVLSPETGQIAAFSGNQIEVWRPDGTHTKVTAPGTRVNEVFWVSPDEILAIADTHTGPGLNPEHFPAAIALIHVATGRVETLADGVEYGMNAALSPDATRLVFVNSHEDAAAIEMLDLRTRDRRTLVSREAGAKYAALQWSADGRRLAWGLWVPPERQARTREAYRRDVMNVEWLDLADGTVHDTGKEIAGRMTHAFVFCGSDRLAWAVNEKVGHRTIEVLELAGGASKSYPVARSGVYLFSIAGGKKLLLAR